MSKVKNTISSVKTKTSPWENLSTQDILIAYNIVKEKSGIEKAFKFIPKKCLSDKDFFMSFIENNISNGEEKEFSKDIYFDYLSNIDIEIFNKIPLFLDDRMIIEEAVRSVKNFKILTDEQRSDFNILQYAVNNRDDELIKNITKNVFEDKKFLNIIHYFNISKIWN